MDTPRCRQRKVRPCPLPTICESGAVHREEGCHRTHFNSELLKTRRRSRKCYTKPTQRFDNNGPVLNDARPLLSSSTQPQKGESEPKCRGGWKVTKKVLRIARPKSSRRLRLRFSLKVLSPCFLFRTTRDAYVRALNCLGGQLSQQAW